jgi:membrane-bound acyltransferase YfiQ involved in biofilm formation
MLFLKLFYFKFLKINPFALKTAKSSFQFTHLAFNRYIKLRPHPLLFQGHISHNAYLFHLMLLLSERVAGKDFKPSNKIMLFAPRHRSPTG